METLQVIQAIEPNGKGWFYIEEAGKRLAEMELAQNGNQLTVYHTEVSPEAEGRGLAKQLLEALVQYAREKKLRIRPLCSFVLGQFKRHLERYADVWMNH